MHLKELEVSGFKSFAKKSVLDFTAPISAIVGPNGSGKSNLTEAFRFVLGEQSLKSMRGKKGEDLIWNGSASSPRANRASARVTFDNSSHFLNIDFDTVAIERVVHRDGTNQYSINGSPVRLRDVSELLASANIGSSGHHIISQGEADRILGASPKERREMIEDALGLKVYQYKKIESTKKLEKTRENVAHIESLRKEVAPHLRFLGKQVERVEKALAMRDELKNLYRGYLKREDVYLSYHRNLIDNEEHGPAEELTQLDKERTQANAVLEQSSKTDPRTKELMELESALAKNRSEKDTLSRDLGRLEGEIAAEKRAQERLARQEQETVDAVEVKRTAQEIEQELDRAQQAQDVETLKGYLAKIRELVGRFLSHSRQQMSEAAKGEETIRTLEERKTTMATQLAGVEAVQGQLREKSEAVRRELEASKEGERDAERKLFAIMSRQQELQNTLGMLRARREQIERAGGDFKRELTEAGVLVGREILDYTTHTVKDEQERELSKEEIANEAREKQEERRRIIEKIKIRLEEFGGGSAEDILKEYQEVRERDEFLHKEIDDLEHSASALEALIKELDEELHIKFKEGIEKINGAFAEFFSLMFGGGSASLSLIAIRKRRSAEEEEEETDEEGAENEEGIEVNVSLPHKRIKGLVMLSGGERALTSIALLFAMSQVNPPPFIILDETDAALDEANSRKYGELIERLSKYSQLILVTHNRETMSRAGILYGITMGSDGVSRMLSVKFEEAVQVAK